MRYFILVLAFLAPTLGFSQTTVVSDYADNYVAGPGMYSAPFVPRVSTPVASFATPPLQVGARNATEGNIVGAGDSKAGQDSAFMSTDFVPSGFSDSSGTQAPASTFNTGASMPQDAFGVAQLASGRPPSRPAVRTFTNADIQRMHDAEAR